MNVHSDDVLDSGRLKFWGEEIPSYWVLYFVHKLRCMLSGVSRVKTPQDSCNFSRYEPLAGCRIFLPSFSNRRQ